MKAAQIFKSRKPANVITTASGHASRGARPAQGNHLFQAPRIRLFASPLAIAALGSAFLFSSAALADDAAGGKPSGINGGFGGKGNGNGGGGGDSTGGGATNNGAAPAAPGAGGTGGASQSGVAGGTGGVADSTAAGAATIISTNLGNGVNAATDGGTGASDGATGGGGGGGGAALVTSNATTNITVNAGVSVTGGFGGKGGNGANGSGGGGGGGNAAIVQASAATLVNNGMLRGGDGGDGGDAAVAGGGGGGGDGLVILGTGTNITNSGSIGGGSGGISGLGGGNGYSGAGGAGLWLKAGGNTITNTGAIAGGEGGSVPARGGAGGIGIITFGNDTINNSGNIRGGLHGSSLASAAAIQFNGTGNRLNLQSGSSISGALELSAGAGAAIAAQANNLALSSAIVLGSGSTLAFDTDSGFGLTVSGVISGTGNVTVGSGSQAVIFTGNNTYSGTTTVTGLLQAGNGGTSGMVGNAVTVGAGSALSFKRSDTVTYGGVVSGSGMLRQLGSGTLILSGNSAAFTGTTNITTGNVTVTGSIGGSMLVGGGDLQVGDGGTSGMIGNTLSISQGNTAAFKRSDGVTYGGTISGNGTLAQSGSGNLTLTGNSANFTGNVNATAGTLTVNGSLGGTMIVGFGGTLAGSGTVGTTFVNSGTLVPGGAGSIGTLTVNGNLTFNNNATFAVDLGAGAGDSVSVTGNAAAAGTVRVNALDSQGSYRNGRTYTILSAAGGLTGTFARATTSSAFLGLTLSYTANAAILGISVSETTAFADVARSQNQRATARALDSLAQSGSSLALYNKLLTLSADEARAAFDRLSGEAQASFRAALANDAGFWSQGLLNRLRDLRDDSEPRPAAAGLAPSGWWVSGFGAWSEHDGDSANTAKLKGSTGGVMGGVDTLLGAGWHAGLAGGYGRSDLRVDGRSSNAQVDSYTAGAYAGARLGNVGLRFGVAHTWHKLDTSRESGFTGFSETNRASYRARSAQIFGEAGYTLRWNTATLEPYVGLAYVGLRTDGYGESGTAGLRAEASSQGLAYATLGARLRGSVRLSGTAGIVSAGLGWRHADGDTTPSVTHAFNGSGSFTVTGVPIARETALVDAGLDLALAKNADLTVSYNGQFASNAKQHRVAANLRWRF